MTLWSLKYIGRLIVKLKAIKYKQDFFCYLSFYPNLGLQAACLQILFFRPHTFRSFPSDRIFLRFLTKHICPSLGSQIYFNNLNLVPYVESLVDQILKTRIAATSQLLSCYCIELQLDRSNTREPYSLRLTSHTFTTHMAISKT